MANTIERAPGRLNGRRDPIAFWLILSLTTLAAFGAPFALPALGAATGGTANGVTASLFLAVVVAISLFAAWSFPAAGGQAGSAKETALLGAVVAADAALRLIPSVGGVSAVFPLIVVAGAVLGPRFGFLTGSLSLILSAVITGGLGPWLPYQMLGAGWVGAGAGFIGRGQRDSRPGWLRLAVLALYGAAAGIAYGVLLSVTSWPLAAPDATAADSLYWRPDLDLASLLVNYGKFYLVTSLAHDLTRAVGNAVLLLIFGPALIRLLQRARLRLHWQDAPPDPAGA